VDRGALVGGFAPFASSTFAGVVTPRVSTERSGLLASWRACMRLGGAAPTPPQLALTAPGCLPPTSSKRRQHWRPVRICLDALDLGGCAAVEAAPPRPWATARYRFAGA